MGSGIHIDLENIVESPGFRGIVVRATIHQVNERISHPGDNMAFAPGKSRARGSVW